MIDVTDVISIQMILEETIMYIKETCFHTTLMESEITSSNDKLLSLCFCYVDSNKELTKSFL